MPKAPDGHLALPATGSGRPVLVLHAWWGLNDTMRAFCGRLADDGFAAFAPDLYHGRVTDTIPGAEGLSSELDPNRARADVAEGGRYLLERAGASDRSGVAVVGFSLGAYFALDLSATDPEHVRSVVLFYGTGPAEFANSRAAYLGHFAENDPYEPKESVDWLEGALKEAGRPVTFHRYQGTGHWFFEPDRADAYNAAAAALAWDRTLDFLKQA